MHVILGLYKQILNAWFIEGKIILCNIWLKRAGVCSRQSSYDDSL